MKPTSFAVVCQSPPGQPKGRSTRASQFAPGSLRGSVTWATGMVAEAVPPVRLPLVDAHDRYS